MKSLVSSTRSEPIRAAQYLRMSTESQIYSIEHQKTAIGAYANTHGFEIVASYEDPGVSGISLSRRRGLRSLLADVISKQADFRAILVYDVSRWGRFQDIDESAHYEFLCKQSGIRLFYCAEEFANDGTVGSDLMKSLKRTMAGEYSRELSVKVSRGQRTSVQKGYWVHSDAPMGYRRMCVTQAGRQKGILRRGDHKFTSDRTILVLGPKRDVETIRFIFRRFLASHHRDEFTRIAEELNAKGLRYHTGFPWRRHTVRFVLTNPIYTGISMWGRRTKKLNGELVQNRQEEWAICRNAFPAIIDETTFKRVQAIITRTWRRKTDEELLGALRRIYKINGKINRKLMLAECVPPSTVVTRFGSLAAAYRKAGYHQPEKYSRNLESHAITWRESESLAAQIASMFPGRVAISRGNLSERPLLRLDSGVTVMIVAARAYRTVTRRIQYVVQWPASTSETDLVLLSLFDELNQHYQAYYLSKLPDHQPFGMKFRRDHPFLRGCANLQDLFRFYEEARRLAVATNATAGFTV